MNVFKRLKIIFSTDAKTLLLFLEAYIFLGWARFLTYLPFTKVVPSLGVQMQETPDNQTEHDRVVLRNIACAIEIMSNHTFWDSKCLVRAIAGMKMLARRRIESTLYLGTAKDESGELIAHAWLRSGPFYITGAEVKNKFTVVGMFAKRIVINK